MKYTEKLGLKKPDQTDFYNVEDFNFNADRIDEELGNLDPIELLNKIKTVGGAGSGLDADFLDGKDSTAFASAEHTHEMGDINNLKLTAENTTVKDTDNNFESTNVEGALKELANEDKTLQINIDNNKKEVDKEITDLKQSVSSGKQLIATAVTGKDVQTNGSDSFQKMADNIDSIKTKLPILDGDAGVAEDSKGNVYGVDKIEARQVYHEFPNLTEISNTNKLSDISYFRLDSLNNMCISANSMLRKFNSSNELLWEFTNSNSVDQLELDKGDNIYVSCSYDSSLRKISPDGTLIWEYITEKSLKCIAIYNDCIYIGLFDGTIVKLNLEGEFVKEIKTTTTSPITTIEVDKYGFIVCISTARNKLMKISPEGAEVWSLTSDPYKPYLMKIDKNCNVVFTSSGYLQRYSQDGILMWRSVYETIYGAGTCLEIDEFNNIFCGTSSSGSNYYLNKFNDVNGFAYSSTYKKAITTNPVRGVAFRNPNIYVASSTASVKILKDNYALEKVAVLEERGVN